MKAPEVSTKTVLRIFSVGVALSTGVILALSLWLDPSPIGHGTHLQLGLGQCTFLTLTGLPCPMCGCTTTFALMAHLHPVKAFLNQPFGATLFVMTVASFVTAVVETVQPRDRWLRLADRLGPYESSLAAIFLAAMTVGWVYKIIIMRWFA